MNPHLHHALAKARTDELLRQGPRLMLGRPASQGRAVGGCGRGLDLRGRPLTGDLEEHR